jgi:hypothetical protein
MNDKFSDAKIELEVGPGPNTGQYTVKVVRAASGGTPRSAFTLDVDALAYQSRSLENVVLASASRARGAVLPELEKPLRAVGSQLFQALFAGPIGSAFYSSLAVARERGAKLQVVLGITAPELAVMPWEALYDGELGGYLCRKEDLIRRIDAPFTPDPLPVRPPLRILAIAASPRGLLELDVDAEQQNLEKAMARPVSMGQVQLEWETQASWSSVHDRLLQEKWHVLHFIGHGDYDPERDVGRIALVGDDGRAEWVDAISLADLLGEAEPTPRLVVLNSCASGQSGSNDLFSGTAATLVRSGICAVAAMQFSVSDVAAVRFPRGFYAALASGRRVDEAVRSGRIEIIGAGGGTLEWVTPILHVRGEATELFQLVGATPAPTTGEPAGERRDPAPESPDRPETRAAHDGSPRTTPEPPVAPSDVVTPAAPVGDHAERALLTEVWWVRRRIGAVAAVALTVVAIAAVGLFLLVRPTCRGFWCQTSTAVAGLEKSVLYLQTFSSGMIHVPPEADPAGRGYWTEKLTYQSAGCTGWYVSKSAKIVTTASCVDPELGNQAILDGYLRDHKEANLKGQADPKWVVGDMQESEVDVRVQAVQPSGADGATIASPTPVEVVDRKPDYGLALLQLPNTNKETPGLVVAQNDPQVGDNVKSIGFNTNALYGDDRLRMIPPSVKPGQVTGAHQPHGGVMVLEVNTNIVPGMAGGPTVNKDGQVIGVNSPFWADSSYITNTPELRTFLQLHNVDLVQPPGLGWYSLGGIALALGVSAGVAMLFIRHRRSAQVS